MKLEEINPFVRQALSAKLTKQNKKDTFSRIQTVDCRFFYITGGQGQMRFADTAYPLQTGTVVLFRAGTEYAWEVDSVHYYAINFDYTQNFSHVKRSFHPIHASEFFQKDIIESPVFDDEPLLNEPLILPFAPELEADVKRILTERLIGNTHSHALLSGLLKQLIVQTVQKKRADIYTRREKATDAVRAVVEYVSKHYADVLTYETLAKNLHFNPSYLNRIFKAQTGQSLHAFLLQYRLCSAMELLRAQSLPVHEIAALCGFPDPYHFTKAFKKYTGITPTAYRTRNHK